MGQLNYTIEEIQANLNWTIGKDSDKGITVDLDTPTFPWVDLIGLVQPNLELNSTSPSVEVFRTGVNAYQYNKNDILDCTYHIPHDWLLSSDAELHVHIGFNVVVPAGETFTITPTAIYGDRDGTFGVPIILEDIVYTTTVSAQQYSHLVIEVPLCRSTPTANQFNSNNFNVDGIIGITFEVNDTVSLDTYKPFIFTADIHHQSTGIGTKNNASPFYG